ncbi:MAG: 5-(carboxyamino)imidazole ribonucleotide synthase [Bacteroidota bacterium]|nr:5-(carboxyamino)imidazole ribonucleotide synthase [Bacteroidota bacterium]
MSQIFYQNFRLGVLGGGQLGRMLIQSAVDLNIDVAVIDPDPNAPCKNITTSFQTGDIRNFNEVYNFGKNCDVITIEIENVNTEALEQLQKEGKKVFPQPDIIKLIQNKRTQKEFYKANNIPTAEFILVDNKEDLHQHVDFLPFVQKLGTAGYDGRGVMKMRSPADFNKAFEAPSLIEKLIDFEKEISVIVARNERGEIRSFPVVELVFHPEKNLVEYLKSPASISEEACEKAENIAKFVIEKLGMIGLLAVEMFLDKEGNILVNEVAPRTHNSGHHTIEANLTSQFDQHLRAILNLPLGSTEAILPAAMVNLLGEDGYEGLARYEGLDKVLALSGVHVHLYGKKITKPFRKMGHVTITDTDSGSLQQKVDFIKNNLKIKA